MRLNEELKPCPFCGSIAMLQKLGNEHHGMCTNYDCLATGSFDTSKKRAIQKWNKRHNAE